MAPTVQILWVLLVIMAITLFLVAIMFYFMIAKPDLWLEWFVNKPYRLWGLQVSIVDKERFRKATRLYVIFPVVMAVIGLLTSLLIGLHRRPM